MRKVVKPPPNPLEHFSHIARNEPDKFSRLMPFAKPTDDKGQYRHWDKLRYLAPPAQLSSEDWWSGIKFARQSQCQPIPLQDAQGNRFQYLMLDSIYQTLHRIDCHANGNIHLEEPVINAQTRDTYLIRSLIEEAISSSQLEGASTTRQIAKEMLASQRKPRNKDEQMIYNNYLAMRFIHDNKDSALTPALVYELHRIVTTHTLEHEHQAGTLRQAHEQIAVVDVTTGETLHTPPPAGQLARRLQQLCDFANQVEDAHFIHPIIRAIILHFMLAYDHPFVDGNGRTARALFYWYVAKQGYWLLEYVSISRILKDAPAQYARAFLYTETDDNDLTYFIIYQLEVIQRAVQSLTSYLAEKARAVRTAKLSLKNNPQLQEALNSRQLALLDHALRHPNFLYDIKAHQTKHGVTYETARKDLMLMAKHQLLDKLKRGQTYVFLSPPDLDGRLGVD